MIESLLSGTVFGMAAGLSPGPLMALVISQTLRYGRREGLKVAVAPLLSDLPIILFSLFAFSRLSNLSEVVAWVSILGGLFAGYLGWESVRVRAVAMTEADAAPRSLAKAVLVNLLNPHVYLFWATIGTPTILRGVAKGGTAPALFVGAFYLCLVGSKAALAVLLGRSRNLLSGPGYVWTIRVLGLLLFGIGVWFVWEGVGNLRPFAS